jgi:hypothetical protein
LTIWCGNPCQCLPGRSEGGERCDFPSLQICLFCLRIIWYRGGSHQGAAVPKYSLCSTLIRWKISHYKTYLHWPCCIAW